jgi:outer membrane receptor protein involved in Fe transport
MPEPVARYSVVTVSAIALMTGWATPLAAQTDPAEESAAAASVDETQLGQQSGAEPGSGTIVVTGTRIRQIGMNAPTPVTALSGEDINSVAPSGVVDALDRLPAFLNSVNASADAGSGVSDAGGTNLNLRGLGTARTLTLLNSRRVVPNNKEGTVNIDIFPELLIERVDLVTGGASAAYGTDAVAGVVNFILDTDFEGLKGNVQGGISKRGDNANGKVQLAYGTSIGERMHVVLSGDYSREEGLVSWEGRDWYRSGALMTNPDRVATGQGPLLISAYEVVGTSFTCGGLITAVQGGASAGLTRLEFLNDGSTQPFVRSRVSAVGPTTNNAQSLDGSGGSGCDPVMNNRAPGAGNGVSPDREKAHLYGFLDYDVTDNVTVFGEVLWSHDWANLGTSAATMVSPWQATIYSDNAFLPGNVRALMPPGSSFTFQRVNTDLYPDSHTILRNRTILATAGFTAEFGTGGFLDGWTADGHFSYGQNRQRVQFFGKEKISTIYVALDAVDEGQFSTGTPNGRIVCRAALLNPSAFGDCVPLNLFGRGNASDAAIDYVTTPRKGESDAITFFYILDQWNAELSMSGEVWEGWGAGPITAAVGGSYRQQKLDSYETGLGALFDTPNNTVPGVRGIPTSIANDPDVHLFDSFADVDGKFDVKEAFAEINIPILSDLPFAESLTANAAVRWADYSGSGTIWSYKGGLEWQAIPDLRLRATYSRDVRAASLSERFDVQRTNGSVSNDPVTGQSYNFSQTTGGNPNVDPERADTLTAGVVLQPTFLPGFAMSVDYFDVSINDAIGQLGTQNIVVQCAAGAQQLCDLITRDPTTQLITNLQNIFINIAEEKAQGLDVEATYRTDLPLFGGEESLELRGLASVLFERSLQFPGAPLQRLDGQIATTTAGDFYAYPKLQWTANIKYENGPFSILLQERFIDGGKLRNEYVEGVDVDDNDVPSVFYTDLGINYFLSDRFELYGFVTNVFDKSPPFAPQPFAALGGSSQTNLQLYDYLGQRFLVGARFEF